MDVKMIVIIILVFVIFFLSIQLSEDQRELAKEELNWVNSVVYLADSHMIANKEFTRHDLTQCNVLVVSILSMIAYLHYFLW